MRSLRKLAGFLRPYWKLAILGPFLMLVEVAMDLAQPRLMQQIVDVGIAQLNMPIVIRTGLIMIGLALVGAFGGAGNTVLAVRVSQGVGADLRSALFHKVQSFSFANLDRLQTGQLVTRLTNDVTQVQEVVLILLRILVRAPLMLVGSIIMAILTSPKLALMLLALAPILLTVVIIVLLKAHPMFAEVQRRLDALNTVLHENLAGVRVVKAFVRSRHEEQRFGTANDLLMSRTVHAVRWMAVVTPFMMVAVNVGIVGALWFGGIEVNQGDMHVGQIMAFINYLLQTLFSLMMVSMLLIQVSRAEASADRILEVLDSIPDIQDRPDALQTFEPTGRVAFENVVFSYNGQAETPVLRNVNFVADPGQTVAILGATGSGKSSLVHLLARFYEVSDGRITMDGVDVRDIRQETLRSHLGIALQESVLFSGTIRDNIRYGRPSATDAEVIAAAQTAQAHDFISSLPQGYDTLLGQRGINLSGGQKQRVAIARALLPQPKILILDDSTSAVDTETEARIQEALNARMSDTTRFVIAQRISTVLNADKILVLDDGVLVAEGTHDELLTTSRIYREIYDSQLGDGGNAHA